jgi:hypothetical protein
MFKSLVDLKDKAPLIWSRPANENIDAAQATRDPGWHDKLGTFFKDQFNPRDGFVHQAYQTVSKPKQWLLDFIDEGNPKPAPLTAEELERAATWATFLASPSDGAKADYVYQPLSSLPTLSTRLVRLLPAGELEDIHLAIECVEVDNCPSYEALSYCWGDPSVNTTVQCDGGSLHVTKNLKSALLYLRSRTEERLLWIDALCINQKDLQERSQQVSIMRDIYRNASETVVWLGEESQNSGLGLALCEKLYEFFKDEPKIAKTHEMQCSYRTPWPLNHQDPFNPSYAQTDEGDFDKGAKKWEESIRRGDNKVAEDSDTASPLRMNPPNVYELLALRDLACRQWFRRIWMAQELALASKATMICGHRSISWDTFIFGFTTTFINGKSTSGGWDQDKNFIGALVHIREWVHRSESVHYRYPVILLDLLHHCRSFEATDPRDKVYGLLGVAPPESEAISVQVDYRKTVEEVYEDIACLILLSSGNLNLLSVPRSNSQLGKRLPSWAPDWSCTASSRLDLVFPAGPREIENGAVREFAASRGSTFTPAFKNPRILVLSGHFVDRIAQLSEIIHPPTVDHLQTKLLGQKLDDRESILEAEGLASMSRYFDVMMSIEDLALPSTDASLYPTGELRPRAFWRTLCTDVSSNHLEAAEQAFTSWQKAMKAPRLLKNYRVDKLRAMYAYLATLGYGVTDSVYDGDGLFLTLMRPAFNSRFAITEMGYFALVPSATKIGDQVGLFKGGKVPLIFRQEGSQWSLVGESYVHGIMDGEAFDEVKCKELELI